MSQLHLSDEILMAFADGELDEPVAAAVAKAMSEDPVIAKRVSDFQQSRRLTHSVFAHALTHEVPPKLQAAVSAQIRAFEALNGQVTELAAHKQAGNQAGRRVPLWQMAMAASVGALAIAAGYFVGQHHGSGANSLLAQLEASPVRDALSRIASGQEVAVSNGRMRVISTFRLANGSLCREFRMQASSGTADAIACRNGQWNVTFATADAGHGAAYTPSDGSDLISAYLQSVNAGEPLVDEAETKALAEKAR